MSLPSPSPIGEGRGGALPHYLLTIDDVYSLAGLRLLAALQAVDCGGGGLGSGGLNAADAGGED